MYKFLPEKFFGCSFFPDGQKARMLAEYETYRSTVSALSTSSPTASPAASPTPPLPITYHVKVQYDNVPKETGWSLVDVASKKLVIGVPKSKARRFKKGRVFKNKTPFNLVGGRVYEITMSDRNGFVKGKRGYILIIAKQGKKVRWTVKASGKFRSGQKVKKLRFQAPTV